jgi:MFS family permease
LVSFFRGKSSKIFFLFAILILGYFYSSLQRISSGVVLPEIGKITGFSAALVGFLSSLFFYSYGFTQNVWGAINDRVGPLKSCAAGTTLTALGSALLLLLPPTTLVVGTSRFLCGLGLASYFTGINIFAALAFPVAEYPFWIGLIQVIGNMGTVAAVSPLGMLMDAFGYRGVFLILTVWALVVASILWIFRNTDIRLDKTVSSEEPGGIADSVRKTLKDVALGFKLVANDPIARCMTYAWSIASAAVITLQGLWGVNWIAASSGSTQETARFWTTWVSVGLVIGAICGSRVSLRVKNTRRGLLAIMISLSGAWAIYLICAAAGLPAYVMGIVGFIIGIVSSTCMVFCISSIKSLVDISHAGLTIGTGQMLLYIAVIIVQWGSGLVINLFPSEKVGYYLNEGYLAAFGGVAAIVLHSTYVAWRMRKT